MSDDQNNLSTSGSRRLAEGGRSRRDRRWFKAAALLLVAVIAGVVIGAGGTLLYVKRWMYRLPPQPDAITEAMLRRITRLTDATPDEERRMRLVLERHMAEVGELRRRFFEDARRNFDGLNAEVDEIFGPERGKAWREYTEERSEERRRRHHGRDGGFRDGMGPAPSSATAQRGSCHR